MDEEQAHQQEEAVGRVVILAASDKKIETLFGEPQSIKTNLIRC